MNYIRTMVEWQKTLNELTVQGWMDKDLNFRRALWIEAAEAMDSTPWKWWKGGTIDIDNIIVEAVDMMHFALSICIQDGFQDWDYLDNKIKEMFINNNNDTSTDDPEELQLLIENISIEALTGATSSWEVHNVVLEIVRLMMAIGMSRDDLLKFYMAKSALNELRQNNGYKDGTYPKQWFGREDNLFMIEEVRKIPMTSTLKDDLYAALELILTQVKSSKK